MWNGHERSQPLNLDLAGSTFAAQPWTDGIELDSIPFKCRVTPVHPMSVSRRWTWEQSRATLGFNGPSSIRAGAGLRTSS